MIADTKNAPVRQACNARGRITYPCSVTMPDSVKAALEGMKLWQGRKLYAKPMSGGLSNANWFVDDGSGRLCFIKVPDAATDFVNRLAANAGSLRASELGIGAKVYEFDPHSGIEVTEFLNGYETCTTTSLRNRKQGLSVMSIYRQLHETELFGHTYTLFDQVDQHLAQIEELGMRLPSWAHVLSEDYPDIKARFMNSGLDLAPCHNDPMPGNFMVKDGQMKIIDFEFCGDNDASCEVGLFLAEMFYDEEDSLPLIEASMGDTSKRSVARVQASRVIGDFKWGMWGLISSQLKPGSFDYGKYGTWKLMRALEYRRHLDWDAVKAAI